MTKLLLTLSGDNRTCYFPAFAVGVIFLHWRSRETGKSRAVSPLTLGGNPLQETSGDGVGDAGTKETDPEDGWRAIWRVVQTHKDRQALERKAAKEASSSRTLGRYSLFL